eukprot:1203206-Karenia_brevis.AAC.1
MAEIGIIVYDPVTGGASHQKLGPAADLADNFRQAVLQSIAAQAAEDKKRESRQSQLRNSLQQISPQADLDLTTPADGHCLLHALRRGGMASRADIPCDLTVSELRAAALSMATPEELQVAAAGSGDRGLT